MFKKFMGNVRGAALAEYMPLLAMVVIVLPGLAFLGTRVPELYGNPPPFETPEGPPVVIEDCVINAQCEVPPVVVDYCVDNFTDGELCDIIPYVVIDPPGEPPVIVPQDPVDPRLQWVVADIDAGVYANSPVSTTANMSDILAAQPYHPAAMYCHNRGGMLPSEELMTHMAVNHPDTLNLVRNIYWTSTQFWAAGGYNPPPVLVTLSYAKNVSVAVYEGGGNGDGHGFLTHAFYVRCVY